MEGVVKRCRADRVTFIQRLLVLHKVAFEALDFLFRKRAFGPHCPAFYSSPYEDRLHRSLSVYA